MKDLLKLYQKHFGKPDSQIELQEEEGEIRFHVVTGAEKKSEYSAINSLGLSLLNDGDHDIELRLQVAGKPSMEQTGETGSFFYHIYKLMEESESFMPGEIHHTGPVPGFEGMDAVLVVNDDYPEAKWLDEKNEEIRVLKVCPLYPEEAEELKKIPADSRELFVYRSAIDFADAKRENGIVYKAILNVWSSIAKWYTENGVDDAEKLNTLLKKKKTTTPGEKLEKELGFKLAADFKASFSIVNETVSVGRFYTQTLEEILDLSKSMTGNQAAGKFKKAEKKLTEDSAIQFKWWHKKWVPVAADSYGDLLCIDMDPGEDGVGGQVLTHSNEEGPATEGSYCFLEWLNQYDNDLKEDVYEVGEDGVITES